MEVLKRKHLLINENQTPENLANRFLLELKVGPLWAQFVVVVVCVFVSLKTVFILRNFKLLNQNFDIFYSQNWPTYFILKVARCSAFKC